MVLGFENFHFGRVRAVGLDPDTYPNPSYSATVQEMSGARLQVVFEDGARGVGVMRVSDLGNVIAFVYPTFTPSHDVASAASQAALR